jgi:hypothetical protein
MNAFYDDGTGMCYWCRQAAVAELFGVPLCPKHYDEEVQKFDRDIGL